MTVKNHSQKFYMAPVFVENTDIGKMAIQMCVNDPEHQFSHNPENFTLYDLGDFNPETGILTTHNPELVSDLTSLCFKKECNVTT